MSQSRKMSLTESIVSILIGFVINFTIQWAILDLLGMGGESAAVHSAWITVVFTITSFARQYGVRRYFNGLAS